MYSCKNHEIIKRFEDKIREKCTEFPYLLINCDFIIQRAFDAQNKEREKERRLLFKYDDIFFMSLTTFRFSKCM